MKRVIDLSDQPYRKRESQYLKVLPQVDDKTVDDKTVDNMELIWDCYCTTDLYLDPDLNESSGMVHGGGVGELTNNIQRFLKKHISNIVNIINRTNIPEADESGFDALANAGRVPTSALPNR